MLNFDYLKAIPELAQLHQFCDLCEQRQYTEPDSAAINARKALEWLVKAIYKLKGIEPGERSSLLELSTSEVFTDFIADPELMRAVHWIRKVGNLAAHDGKVTRREVRMTVEMAAVMMRSKSESARARRLLNAILPHAIALEALELEQEILAMIETIDSNLVHDSAWKNFLDKVQRSARSAMRKIKKEESAGENEMESDAGEADGDTEKTDKK